MTGLPRGTSSTSISQYHWAPDTLTTTPSSSAAIACGQSRKEATETMTPAMVNPQISWLRQRLAAGPAGVVPADPGDRPNEKTRNDRHENSTKPSEREAA